MHSCSHVARAVKSLNISESGSCGLHSEGHILTAGEKDKTPTKRRWVNSLSTVE